ncbi:hypothetical protein BT63DRAFT_430508 [Microthyrium microscopicum]|uniref:Ubiquitin-like protease family profile domain-containing protein n=1 Tax=Microthyrium microscopicum TaxID=703497 RepID=A0A6A6TWJ1_9PEZI|nr:hypothetical protein BT63DRAFT_430508 [Microthyrium microscopicum]
MPGKKNPGSGYGFKPTNRLGNLTATKKPLGPFLTRELRGRDAVQDPVKRKKYDYDPPPRKTKTVSLLDDPESDDTQITHVRQYQTSNSRQSRERGVNNEQKRALKRRESASQASSVQTLQAEINTRSSTHDPHKSTALASVIKKHGQPLNSPQHKPNCLPSLAGFLNLPVIDISGISESVGLEALMNPKHRNMGSYPSQLSPGPSKRKAEMPLDVQLAEANSKRRRMDPSVQLINEQGAALQEARAPVNDDLGFEITLERPVSSPAPSRDPRHTVAGKRIPKKKEMPGAFPPDPPENSGPTRSSKRKMGQIADYIDLEDDLSDELGKIDSAQKKRAKRFDEMAPPRTQLASSPPLADKLHKLMHGMGSNTTGSTSGSAQTPVRQQQQQRQQKNGKSGPAPKMRQSVVRPVKSNGAPIIAEELMLDVPGCQVRLSDEILTCHVRKTAIGNKCLLVKEETIDHEVPFHLISTVNYYQGTKYIYCSGPMHVLTQRISAIGITFQTVEDASRFVEYVQPHFRTLNWRPQSVIWLENKINKLRQIFANSDDHAGSSRAIPKSTLSGQHSLDVSRFWQSQPIPAPDPGTSGLAKNTEQPSSDLYSLPVARLDDSGIRAVVNGIRNEYSHVRDTLGGNLPSNMFLDPVAQTELENAAKGALDELRPLLEHNPTMDGAIRHNIGQLQKMLEGVAYHHHSPQSPNDDTIRKWAQNITDSYYQLHQKIISSVAPAEGPDKATRMQLSDITNGALARISGVLNSCPLMDGLLRNTIEENRKVIKDLPHQTWQAFITDDTQKATSESPPSQTANLLRRIDLSNTNTDSVNLLSNDQTGASVLPPPGAKMKRTAALRAANNEILASQNALDTGIKTLSTRASRYAPKSGVQRPQNTLSSQSGQNVVETFIGTRQNPKRNTRAKPKSPTPPAPPIHRFSVVTGLGKPWDKRGLTYPKEGKRRAHVNFEDLERLDDGEFLNDNLIQFNMRYQEEIHPLEESGAKVFAHNSHFYVALTGDGTGTKIQHQAVARWTKDVNIFEQDLVVFPVCQHMHWFMAIAKFPPNLFSDYTIPDSQEPPPKVTIYTLDPLGHLHQDVTKNLKEYLIAEAKDKLGKDLDRKILQGVNLKNIPTQDNLWDCGIFVCDYYKKLRENPTEFGQKLMTNSFTPWEVDCADRRKKMREKLQELYKEQEIGRKEKKKEELDAKEAEQKTVEQNGVPLQNEAQRQDAPVLLEADQKEAPVAQKEAEQTGVPLDHKEADESVVVVKEKKAQPIEILVEQAELTELPARKEAEQDEPPAEHKAPEQNGPQMEPQEAEQSEPPVERREAEPPEPPILPQEAINIEAAAEQQEATHIEASMEQQEAAHIAAPLERQETIHIEAEQRGLEEADVDQTDASVQLIEVIPIDAE